jgi:N-formylglutamate amidohydrolase
MEERGQGIAYVAIDGCTRNLTDEDRQQIYQSYHEARQAFYDIAKMPETLIIDCHSFPSDLAPDIDFCIGFNDDDTKLSQKTINLIVKHFQDAGFRVGINSPYSNSVCASMDPLDIRTKTIMIEVNKSVYLESDGITPNEDFEKIKQLIEDLYRNLLAY